MTWKQSFPINAGMIRILKENVIVKIKKEIMEYFILGLKCSPHVVTEVSSESMEGCDKQPERVWWKWAELNICFNSKYACPGSITL